MPLSARAAALTLSALVALAGSPAGAQATAAAEAEGAAGYVSQDMTPAAARLLARRALDIGRSDLAASIARQILAAIPDDPEALMLLAASEAQLGNNAAAAAAAKRAFAMAERPDWKFESAYLAAYALSLADRKAGAKFWLRRASDFAPDAAGSSAVAKGYRDLAARSPLSTRLSLDAGPSANVNGGSRHGTMEIFGLPFNIPEALPGSIWSIGLDATYRLGESERGVTELFGSVTHQSVWLSDEALAIAPEARPSDFAYSQIDAGIERRWLDPGQTLVYRLSAAAMGNWYGGEPLSQGLRLRGQIDWTGRPGEIWTGAARLEALDSARNPARDATTSELSVGWQKTLAGGARLGLDAGVRRTVSEAADVENDTAFARLSYSPDALPLGIAASFNLGVAARRFPQMSGFGTDLTLTLGTTLTFTEADVMGFAPQVTIHAERTRSEFAPRDTENLSIGLGIVSRF